MVDFDAKQIASYKHLCSPAYSYAQILERTIFAKITDQTTPEQFQSAQQSLILLCREIEAQLDWTHYPAVTGTHQCVRDIYTDAAFRLKNLALLQPAPQPPPPAQQLITREGIVIDLEERIQTSAEDTYLGTDDNLPDNETTT
jgi:hypothetical protein